MDRPALHLSILRLWRSLATCTTGGLHSVQPLIVRDYPE
jgi:hypothetical protein